MIDTDTCLQPPQGVFDPNVVLDDSSALSAVLMPEHLPGVVLSIVVRPPFEVAYIIFVVPVDVYALPTETQQDRVVLRREQQEAPEQVMGADESVATLDAKTVATLREAWLSVLARTQYPRAELAQRLSNQANALLRRSARNESCVEPCDAHHAAESMK